MFKAFSRGYITAFLLSTILFSLVGTPFLNANYKGTKKSSKLDRCQSKSKKKRENKEADSTSKSTNGGNTNNLTNTLHQTITLATAPGTPQPGPTTSAAAVYAFTTDDNAVIDFNSPVTFLQTPVLTNNIQFNQTNTFTILAAGTYLLEFTVRGFPQIPGSEQETFPMAFQLTNELGTPILGSQFASDRSGTIDSVTGGEPITVTGLLTAQLSAGATVQLRNNTVNETNDGVTVFLVAAPGPSVAVTASLRITQKL